MNIVLPAWFDLDAQTVRADGNLVAGQFDKNQDNAVLDTEIARRITETACEVIDRIRRRALKLRLISGFDDDLTTLLSDSQKQRIITATKQLLIAIYNAGLDDEGSQAVAKQLADGRGEAIIGGVRVTSVEAILNGLEDDLETLAEIRSNRTVGASSVALTRDDDGSRTEYGCNGDPWLFRR